MNNGGKISFKDVIFLTQNLVCVSVLEFDVSFSAYTYYLCLNNLIYAFTFPVENRP